MKLSAIIMVAKLTDIHLLVLGAGSTISSVDKGLCLSNHVVKPLQQFAVRVIYFALMKISLGQKFTVSVAAVGLDGSSITMLPRM